MNYQDTRNFLSTAKFFESYSRWNDNLNRYETWEEAVGRVMQMHRSFYASKMTPELESYIDEAEEAYKNKLVLGAQRALQFGGEQILKNHMKMYNCTTSYADRPEFFGEFFWIALSGAGIGFSVQKHHVAKLPRIKLRTKAPKLHTVEDSIEGWATAFDVLLSSFFEGGGKHPEYEGRRVYFDLSLVRPKGSKISGGFKAPGPEPLRAALDKVEYLLQGLVLNTKKEGVQLKPISVYDMCMHISDAVISGGVRRAATICLFSSDDQEMIVAKSGDWYVNNPQRARSNNSAVIIRNQIDFDTFKNIMESIKKFAEPGFIFVDSTEHLYNPCVEAGMLPQIDGISGWQGCNLEEINGAKCTDTEVFYQACRAAAILGTLQAGYTDFTFLSDTSKKIFDREALIGVSVTGWMNSPDVLFDRETLNEGANIVKEVNEQLAKILGINPAARTTCVKPSGNASVILGSASGIHAEHSPMYIRNVQMNKDSEVAQLIKKTNPAMVEESVWSNGRTDYVISFPIIPPVGSLYKDDITGVKHLELVKLVQESWVETGTNLQYSVDPTLRHNVSNTIIVKDNDWDEVAKYVFDNRHVFAGISFISDNGEKDFAQAPNTKIMSMKELIKVYGTGAVFASGLIVDGLKAFNNDLWVACLTVYGFGDDISLEDHDNLLKKDWVRRFKKFAGNYYKGDLTKTEHCLKDVFNLHKWEKIHQNFNPVNFETQLHEKRFIDVDTLGSVACSGGACEISF